MDAMTAVARELASPQASWVTSHFGGLFSCFLLCLLGLFVLMPSRSICPYIRFRMLVHCVVPLAKQIKASWLHSRHMHWHFQTPSWPWWTHTMLVNLCSALVYSRFLRHGLHIHLFNVFFKLTNFVDAVIIHYYLKHVFCDMLKLTCFDMLLLLWLWIKIWISSPYMLNLLFM